MSMNVVEENLWAWIAREIYGGNYLMCETDERENLGLTDILETEDSSGTPPWLDGVNHYEWDTKTNSKPNGDRYKLQGSLESGKVRIRFSIILIIGEREQSPVGKSRWHLEQYAGDLNGSISA